MTDDACITLRNEHLSVALSPLGAEMRRLQDGEGRDLQWDGDPAVWNGRAPILFPVIGLLVGGGYTYRGQRYAMPKHGFARHSRFDVVARDDRAATFRLSANAETRPLYPFEFRLDLDYALTDTRLSISATIANQGTEPMPASFGFHPAFRWPLPFGHPRDGHRLVFAADEAAPIRRIGPDGFLKPAGEPTPVEGHELRLRDHLFVDDALIFDAVRSRSLRYGAPSGPQIAVTYDDFPTLGVWTKPGAGFVCIEPWQGLPDPEGFAGDIFTKPGILSIAPGESRRLTMTIALVDG